MKFRVLFSSLTVLLGVACSSEKEIPKEDQTPKTPSEAIRLAARDKNIDERVLLTAAFVESNLGRDVDFSSHTNSSVKRTPLFSLQESDVREAKVEATDMLGHARILAEKISQQAEKKPPKDAFDWLLYTARAAVGDLPNVNVRDVSVRLMLLDLIQTYNSGFMTALNNGDVVHLEPLNPSEKITLDKIGYRGKDLDNGFRWTADYGDKYLGNKDAALGTKKGTELPQIILRWCPASTLKCFDHLRETAQTPAHYLSFRGITGERHFLKLHEDRKDLGWYNGTQLPDGTAHPAVMKNAITIMFSGYAGTTPDTLKADWMDWEDYVWTQKMIYDVMSYFKTEPLTPADKVVSRIFEVHDGATLPADLPVTPAGKFDFPLPLAWDSDLFKELIQSNTEPRVESSIVVLSPRMGERFEGDEVYFQIAPDADTRRLQIFQDNYKSFDAAGKPLFGKLWDFFGNYDVRDTLWERRETFINPGASGNKTRSIKIVSRNARGDLISSRIVTFVVNGIQVK